MTKDFRQKYKYLAKNTLWYAVSSFGSKMLSVFLVPMYTSILSAGDYGIADLISTTSSMLSFVLTLCISDAVLRFAIEFEDERDNIVCFGLGTVWRGGALLAVGVLLCILLNVFEWPKYCYLFLLLEYLTSCTNSVVLNALRARDQVKEVATASLLCTVCYMLFTILFLVVFRMGLVGYLLALCVGNAVSCVYGFLQANVPLFRSAKNALSKEIKTGMLKYSTPLIFNGISWWVNSGLDKYFLLYFCGTSSNGIYAVAGRIPGILSVIQSIFGQAWTISSLKDCENKDTDLFFSTTYTYYSAMIYLGCCVLILANIPLSSILFSKNFFTAWQCVSMLLLATVFGGLSSVLSGAIMRGNRSRILAWSTIAAACVNTVLNYLLIPRFAIRGAATATAVSFAVMWLIRFIMARKMMELKLPLVRDLTAVGLLGIQIIAEHTESHLYPVQIAVFVLIASIYHKQLWMAVKLIFGQLKIIISNRSR